MAHAGGASETTALLSDDGIDNFEPTVLHKTDTLSDLESVARNEDGELETTYKAEARILFRFAWPLVLTYVLQYSYNVVCVYVSGQLGTIEQGATSLATMTANVTGQCIYEGLATCLDTLTSQAYGAGRKKLVGLHVQRMMGLMLVSTLFIAVIWLPAPLYLTLIVPEKETAHLAGQFLQILLIGMPGFGLFETAKRFTQAQGHFLPSLIPVLICAPLNLLWNYLYVFKFGFGLRGAALALATTNLLQPIVFVLFVRFFMKSTHECWPGFSFKHMFQNWGTMIKLGGPGILMVVSEWLAFDILTFAASWLGSAELAAQSVLSTVGLMVWHIPMPVAIAAATRFGNLIGMGALQAGRKAVIFYYCVFACIGIFNMVLLSSLGHVIAQVFSKDEAVRHIITRIITVVAASQGFDALSCGTNGLLRGLGKQKIGGWINLAAYYIWGVPVALFLAFGPPKLSLLGLWIGPLSGLVIVFLLTSGYIKWSNWQHAVDEARAREE